jgi:hypothetical protein
MITWLKPIRSGRKHLLLLLAAAAAGAQQTAVQTAAARPPLNAQLIAQAAAPPKATAQGDGVTYEDGQLKIDVRDVTLGSVLNRVAALTHVKFDLPPAINPEKIPSLRAGPGPVRKVLSDLLRESDFDFLIQASDLEPEGIKVVMVMARDGKGGFVATEAEVRASGITFSKKGDGAADSPAATQSSDASSQAADLAQAAALTAPAPEAPRQSPMLFQPVTRPATPPSSMTPQNITQTLQQMYQQRAAMMQQGRQAGAK